MGFLNLEIFAANEAFEKMGSYGLVPNMIVYLMNDYKIGVAKGTNILFFWSAASNFAPIFGAFLSDSYLGHFITIGLGSLFSLMVVFTQFSFSLKLIFFRLYFSGTLIRKTHPTIFGESVTKTHVG